MKLHLAALLLAFPLVAVAPVVQAQSTGTDPGPLAAYGVPGEDEADPAAYFRELGIQAQLQGRYLRAHEYFLRAARLSDKVSQAAIAEQYWEGQDRNADRVLGYIWMDLAAERGTPAFVAMRERYWEALSEDERARVLAQGPALYADYGDEHALQRKAQAQRREDYKTVGSRLGWDSNVDLCIGLRQDAYYGCVTSVPAEVVRKR